VADDGEPLEPSVAARLETVAAQPDTITGLCTEHVGEAPARQASTH
jgi:hypothetical protein